MRHVMVSFGQGPTGAKAAKIGDQGFSVNLID